MNDVSFRIVSRIEKGQKSENPETFKAFFTKDIIIRRIVKIIIRRFDLAHSLALFDVYQQLQVELMQLN